MQHLGTKELQTDRVYLRRLRKEDAQMMYDNWASDSEVTRYLTWDPHTSPEETAQLLAMWEAEYVNPQYYHWAMWHKESHTLIGSISVVSINEETESAMIGYCMSPKFWNQGIMTETVKAVNTFLLKEVGFHRVEAYHHVKNPASGKVMAKSGMIFEGVRRGAVKHRGEYIDVANYAILQKDLHI